jgi:hypothetical protein
LFGAKTQLAVNPVMIVHRSRGGPAKEVTRENKRARSDSCE